MIYKEKAYSNKYILLIYMEGPNFNRVMNAGGAYEQQTLEEEPGQAIELHISCTNLTDLDTFSKSDP